jgi:hypothetical protein
MASDKIIKTEEEWRAILSPAQFKVLRQQGTERAFTGEYENTFDNGTYLVRFLLIGQLSFTSVLLVVIHCTSRTRRCLFVICFTK